MIDGIRDLGGTIAIVVTWVIGWVGWMVKLELRTKGSEREIQRMREQRAEDRASMKDRYDRIDKKMDQQSEDIKAILKEIRR